jgi:hypothetical protein
MNRYMFHSAMPNFSTFLLNKTAANRIKEFETAQFFPGIEKHKNQFTCENIVSKRVSKLRSIAKRLMVCSFSGNQYNSYGGGGQQHFMPPQAHGGYGGGGPAYQGQTHQPIFTIFFNAATVVFLQKRDKEILVLIIVVISNFLICSQCK